MLPSEYLSNKQQGETVIPLRLKIDSRNLTIATEVIRCFEESVNQTQGELNRRLQEFEGDSPDYRLKRGLAHLLRSSFCTFEIISPLEPVELRQKVFAFAAQTIPSSRATEQTLEKLATQLSQELNREVLPHHILSGLYADLQENDGLKSKMANPGKLSLGLLFTNGC